MTPVAMADRVAFESAMRAGKGCDVWPYNPDHPPYSDASGRDAVYLAVVPAAGEPTGTAPPEEWISTEEANRRLSEARGEPTGTAPAALFNGVCINSHDLGYRLKGEPTGTAPLHREDMNWYDSNGARVNMPPGPLGEPTGTAQEAPTQEEVEAIAHRTCYRYHHGSHNPSDNGAAEYVFERDTLRDFVAALRSQGGKP